MCLLAAAELNEEVCVSLSHKLFADYWVDNTGVLE